MLRWERIEPSLNDWNRILESFPDHTLFQSSAWLAFLQQSISGELVFAVLRDHSTPVGYFVGMIVTKLGLRILGSPLPGWTTSYMGFVLSPEVSRLEAMNELKRFAFNDLHCVHLELMDRHLDSPSLPSRYQFRSYNGFEIDLSREEETLFSNFAPACRRCVRKATRANVFVEEAQDYEFASDYFEQLREVFARQRLVPTYDIDRVFNLIAYLQPTGNLLLLRARSDDGRCIATGIFPAMNDRAYFWGGASWQRDQHLRPNETLMWYAMRFWKRRGIRYFDLGGGGDYKRKFGPREISIPWLRISRYPVLPAMRNSAMVIARLRQRWQGAWPVPAGVSKPGIAYADKSPRALTAYK